ncbi:MAG: TetR/AcrR family transcriptional regulator [Aestuariivirga sp.]
MTEVRKRRYSSNRRAAQAEETRARILAAARKLFADRDVEAVPMAEIAEAAGVAVSTLFATFRSRDGILRALMQAAMFGPHTREALASIETEADPVRRIAATAKVARAIYEGETRELGPLCGFSQRSAGLRTLDAEFDTMRMEMQAPRIAALFAAGRARPDLTEAEAARIMWTLTARPVWLMLTVDGGWTPTAYEAWLGRTLHEALVAP